MIPLIPTLALAFLSFIASAFVILRIVIPILPPHPLSRRVPPSEFGLPNFRSLTTADKGHLWLATVDLLALVVFIWQAIDESLGGPSGAATTTDPLSAARLWFSLTVRQICLLAIVSLTLLHVRMGTSISLGKKQWMLWLPVLTIVATSTTVAGVLSGAGLPTLYPGLAAFDGCVAALSSAAFVALVWTLIKIKRNLAALNEPHDVWPPVREEEKPRPSFATEDVDALRENASWITSNASSRHDSISGWSFSTHHTAQGGSQRGHPAMASNPSIPAKSSYWFNPATPYGGRESPVPPVPPLPSPYRDRATPSPPAALADDPDPFRRDLPGKSARERMGSQTSWLTSAAESQTTVSQWSYPTTHPATASIRDVRTELLASTAVSRPNTPAMSSAQVLGGYGFAPHMPSETEKGLEGLAAPAHQIDVALIRIVPWLITFWLPFGLSLPYLLMVSMGKSIQSPGLSLLLVLSVTISSPLLALNIVFRAPMPIPSGLFESTADTSALLRATSPQSGSGDSVTRGYKHSNSTSVTVVEGRRSGDVWISKGDAVEGQGKLSRGMGMLSAKPKLMVLPSGVTYNDEPVTPTQPTHIEATPEPVAVRPTRHSVSQSVDSAELGRIRKVSGASTRWSGGEDALAHSTRIMIAQRHYSAVATTVLMPPSPEKDGEAAATATGAAVSDRRRSNQHLRTRSASSFSGPQSVSTPSPPPSAPLPPTPPSLKASRIRTARMSHKKSYSSGQFSFGAVGNDSVREIDALTAGVLPILVPGLKVGHEMRVREGIATPHGTRSRTTSSKRSTRTGKRSTEFGWVSDFSSPEIHSTPVRERPSRQKKSSTKHFSLPSLGLGKDGVHSLKDEINRVLATRVGAYATISSTPRRPNTVYGGEVALAEQLDSVPEEKENQRASAGAQLARNVSRRTLGLDADVPKGVNTARSSVATLLSEVARANELPPSAASTVTLFDFEGSGPEAQSTPKKGDRQSHQSDRAPPIPPVPAIPETLVNSATTTEQTTNRRSSIVYIKSDTETPASPDAPTQSAGRTFAQWSSRAVRPLMSKTSLKQLQRKKSSPDANSKPGSPSGGGLRQLSLLQDRDPNMLPASPGTTTRPLALGKKQQQRSGTAGDENALPGAGRRNLKPLQLARSDTSKVRAFLRKGEVLPSVVVRPPSDAQHEVAAYRFR